MDDELCPAALYSQMMGDSLADFYREAKVLVKLRHPHIVELFGVAHDGERFYLVTEVRGDNDDERDDDDEDEEKDDDDAARAAAAAAGGDGCGGRGGI
jgi:hypothetical protein